MRPAWAARLLTCGAALGFLVPEPLLAAEVRGAAVPAEIRDVALNGGGRLAGRVVDGQGQPVVAARVLVLQIDREAGRGLTDSSGNFNVGPLRGGVYQIVADESTGTYRLWTAQTAPPSAAAGVLLVSPAVLRGRAAQQFFTSDAFLIGAVVLGAIAIPVAIHTARRDQPPGS